MLVILALVASAPAQTAEGKLAAIEKLSPLERQQKLLEGAGGEAVVYALLRQ